jgi:hypothetical protein
MWKNVFFFSGRYKRGLQVCIGKWKGHPSKLHGVRKKWHFDESEDGGLGDKQRSILH